MAKRATGEESVRHTQTERSGKTLQDSVTDCGEVFWRRWVGPKTRKERRKYRGKTERRCSGWVQLGGHAAWAFSTSGFTWLEALRRLLGGVAQHYSFASAASDAAVLLLLLPCSTFARAWSAVWARVLAVSVAVALRRGRLRRAGATVRFLDSGLLRV